MQQDKERNQLTGEFTDIVEIRDIVSSANMGIWRIEEIEGVEPRMFVDETMKRLLGIAKDVDRTPEETYTDWFSNITSEAVSSVYESVGRMKQGYFDENTYLWNHPTKGVRYVRCGGTAKTVDGGYILKGYHYDVDEIVRREQAQAAELQEALNKKEEYYATLDTLEGIFYSLHMIDLINDTTAEYNAKSEVRQYVDHRQGAREMMVQVMSALTVEEYKEEALAFTDLSTLADRMGDKKVITKQLKGVHTGWFLASFVAMERDENEKVTKVVYITRVIDEAKQYEKRLIEKSQTDEITGLFNRRAYEEDIYAHNDCPIEDSFIYVSLDVNGLKVVNDTKGHLAGDELIIGCCQCMKQCFGPYGKLYRIGGDEFVAILTCNNEKVVELFADFDQALVNWTGELVDQLSVSYGWTSKEEHPESSVRQLGAIAEQRMYQAKDAYYKKIGFDRRGQKDAHKALCELYTKILMINVTDDSYQIINMDDNERTVENGFADTISSWFTSFADTGHIHPDDVEEFRFKTDLSYISKYFESNKTSLHVFYRRKYVDGFKQVMMEMIPATNYSHDNQSLFLYVKNIDK